MSFTLLSLTEDAPLGFVYRPALKQKDLRRAVFALYGSSLEEVERAIEPWREHLFGILVTEDAKISWQHRGGGIYHYVVPRELRGSVGELLASTLQQLQRNLELTDSNRQLSVDLARATEDRARLGREFADVRNSLLREL